MAAADEALQATPGQLPELGHAGVVDAGGRGLVLVLAALAEAVGAPPTPLTSVRSPVRPSRGCVGAAEAGNDGEHRLAGFEVQYLLDAPDSAVRRLRQRLDELGRSVAVVGTGPHAWKVHVHVDEVGPAIEAGLAAGRAHDISVVRLGDRAAPVDDDAAPVVDGADRPAGESSRVVVAVVTSRSLAGLLHREGVLVAAAADVTGPDLALGASGLAARVPGRCDEVVLLVGESTVPVAEEAARALRRRGARTAVVPVRSPVQALAAVAVHDGSRRFDDDVVAMAEAAGATRWAELTVADTAGLTAVGLCQPGDVLGLIDGDVVEIGHSVLAVALHVLDRLLGIGAELVTVVVGAGAPPAAADVLAAHVRRRSALTDVAVYRADDLGSPVVIGAE